MGLRHRFVPSFPLVAAGGLYLLISDSLRNLHAAIQLVLRGKGRTQNFIRHLLRNLLLLLLSDELAVLLVAYCAPVVRRAQLTTVLCLVLAVAFLALRQVLSLLRA